ncbi:AP-4 complex accessory subunit RUSC1 isoform X1 [Pleurodeles waltl]|uniref:AP-4 complex accessory subunit RUSC1 isoform X1 n=1 Tax=Pleurodeles waltl TaxID=8319 RepID=UPI0037098D60
MFASKKGILGNLNHIRLQHVSLGLHLSLRPEMQEGPITRAPSEPEEQTAGCQHCQEETTGNFEVDANSNNTAAQCRCCESHPHQLLKSGLLNEPPSHVENVGDHKEEATSPTDAVLSTLSVSSSISSCSDFTLEETPVSFYCREFLSDGIPSPENQPDIIPLEDSVVNANCLTSEQAQLRHPSEDRYSGPDPLEVDQPRYLTLEKEGEKIYHDLLHSDPSGVFLEIPERPWNKKIEEEMDSHHNTISGLQVQSSSIPPNITEEQDTSFNKIPRTRSISDQKCLPLTKIGPASQVWSVEDGKTTLDDLFGAAEVPQIKCERSLPSVLERTQEGRPGDTKKNITSFHELAQRRKRATTGTTPQPAKKDRSDWLITFSPDTELPPVNELTSSVLYQRYEGMDTSISKQANPDKHSQTGVTTFKELRFRSTLNKQSNQQGKVQGVWEPLDQSDTQRPGTSRIEPNMNIHLGSDNKEPPNRDLSHFKGPLPAHVEAKQRRGLSRHSLQPIAESHLGGTEASWTDSLEEGSATPLGQRCTATGNDPWSRGKADGGDRHSKEVSSLFSHYPRPQTLQFPSLLLRFSAGEVPVSHNQDLTVSSSSSSLENVEDESSVVLARPFNQHLKALSCNEVCLLGKKLGYLSPEELLPIRLSPVGAYSPPYRGVLPLLENPGLSVLLSPLFPRSRTFPSMSLPTHRTSDEPPAKQRDRRPAEESTTENQSGSGAATGRHQSSKRAPWRTQGSETCWTNIQRRPCRCILCYTSVGPVWMAAGSGSCAHHQEQKKGLLVAVSSSVDKIISHFSTTRNIVQKAQLGDSWLSPEVGHLILNTLCPALYALVGDGLKPFQKDVIVGRRRTSPWTVVEASVKPGPATRPLHNLYSRICQLPQLGSSKNKFNTFVFGLLNAKLLDFWVSHLQEHSGTLSWLYLPGGFLSITKDSFYSFFEELLLVLQPLSILTFHLDLLFEHHHLRVNLRLLQPSAGTSSCQAQGHAPSTGLKQGEGCSPREAAAGQCSEDDKQQQEHTAAKNRTVCIGSEQKRPFQNPAPISKQCTDAQSSGPLQNTFEQVLQWGNKLTHTLVGSEESPAVAKVPVKETCTKSSDKSREDTDVKAKTWWGQLSQASQVYSTLNREGFPFTRWTKIKMSTVDKFPAASPNLSAGKTKSEREVTNHKKQYERNQTKEHHEGGSSRATRATLDQPKKKTDGSEAQESQDEGHKKNQETYEEGNQEPRSEEAPEQGSPGIQESSLHETPVRHESSDYVSPLTQELSDREAQRSHKLHDDGTHVFGTQEMLDRNSQGLMTPNFQMKEDRGTIADAGPHKDPHRREAESPSRGIWLGHLFGAPCSSTKRSPSDVETNGVKSRRPSSWLPPNMNVLELMRKVVPPEKTALPEESSKVPVEAPKLIRTVRAICDHTGSSGSHLSFQKDEVLQLLSTVDDDWIRCCHGSNTGLVPVAYTSLIL